MSFATSNEVRKYIRQIFGTDIEIREATFPLRIQPKPMDVEGASPLDPTDCVFVHSIKRMYDSQMVIFWKRVAYLDMLDPDGVRRVYRFIISRDATKRSGEFDRGKPFTIGTAITLLPPPKTQTLKHTRKRWKANKDAYKKSETRHARLAGILSRKQKSAALAATRMKKAMANEKLDTRKLASIKKRKEAADAAVKAAQSRLAVLAKKKQRRAPKIFDLTTRNGAIGNYKFSAPTPFTAKMVDTTTP